MVNEGSQRAQERIAAINHMAEQANDFADMDYSFLYDKGRQLLTIGYSVGERRRDASYYDYWLRSQVCSFIGIAQGHLPQETGLRWTLADPSGKIPGAPCLDGSMFEYLMRFW